MDNNGANVIHYASVKCERVARSVLAAELFVFALGFDQACVIQNGVMDILQCEIDLKMYTDSKCLFDSLISLSYTTEKASHRH